MFSLAYSAQTIIWVIVRGRGTMVAPMLGSYLLQMFKTWAGTLPNVNANLLLGIILVAAVLLLPKGIVPTAQAAFARLRRGRNA